LYDKGGEGIAYHDADSVNNGSGKLNPPNGNFLNEFRMHEGVDISYTKSGAIDNNPYNKIMPELNQLYLGWTQPGEWINYTLKVNETGLYRIAVVYTSNAGGVIALDIDGTPTGGPLKISSTYDARDTVAWRQWHHWNKIDSLAEVKMKKGIHLLTLHIIEQGNMNFDYLALLIISIICPVPMITWPSLNSNTIPSARLFSKRFGDAILIAALTDSPG